ncbi:hypothetical protein KOR34_41820 [Posidoniimonas corsicana]|uniref:Autotransporter-associated beta strand repeat protein n=1 Tax=Posidoniimonas corsicana TaxID=1938618 RepID=A0A5C5V3A6_9BACT|nr:hypothetical protein [Posidoniimonas corsicana]TWT32419.1 hypothetical protein KOR34_41820 [Posidoniimonas corsicana]
MPPRVLQVVVLAAALLSTPLAEAEVLIADTTLTEDLVVPAGETGVLGGTVYLQGHTIESFGSLLPREGDFPVALRGPGTVALKSHGGGWVQPTYNSSLRLRAGVELIGESGAQFMSPNTVNQGVIAAEGDGFGASFRVTPLNLVNEGVIEARDGGRLEIADADVILHRLGGVMRAQPGGLLRLQFDPITSLDDLGPIENLGGMVSLWGQIDNAGRTLNLTGGQWELYGASVSGGVVNAPNSPLVIYESTLADVVVNGDVDSPQYSNVRLEGDLTINGQWTSAWAIDVRGDHTIDGAGVIRSAFGSGWFDVDGSLTIGAGVKLLAESGAAHRLLYGEYNLRGVAEADGGVIFPSSTATVNNDGQMIARNGGVIYSVDSRFRSNPHTTINNLAGGEIRAEQGGVIGFYNHILNDGAIVIDGGEALIGDYDVDGTGTVTITNSLILGDSVTLAELHQAPRGAGSEYGTHRGRIDLEGQTLTLADIEGQRFTLRGGTLAGGVVASADGHPLEARPRLAGVPTTTELDSLQLDADLLVLPGAKVEVHGSVTGEGRFGVDGGVLRLEPPRNQPGLREMIARSDLRSGAVELAGTLFNTGQTTALAAGVDWQMAILRTNGVVGGRLEGEPGARLTIVDGYGSFSGQATFADNVTLALPVSIGDTTMAVRGGLTLDGATVTIGVPNGSEFGDGRLEFAEPQVLAGVGEVVFNRIDNYQEGHPYPRVNMLHISPGQSTNSGLTVEQGITVRTDAGDGYVGGRYFYQLDPEPALLTNYGRFVAQHGHTLSIFTSDFQQHGVLRAEAGSLLRVVDEDLVNQRRLETTGGQIEVTGELALADSSVLMLELALDQLATSGAAVVVGGAAELGGRLKITSPDERWIPQAGDAFTLLSAAGGLSGAFASQSLPMLADGLYWQVGVGANDLQLSVQAGALTGDYNSDGVVDAADYTVWRDNVGLPIGLPNEVATSGQVTIEDLAAWRENYGVAAASAAVGAPAPASSALLAVLAACCVRGRSPPARWE